MHRGLVLIGKPGAGKGTQARMLAPAPGLLHVEMGQILRQTSIQGSELGHRLKRMLDQGELLPDELVMGAFTHHLQSIDDNQLDADTWLLIDGLPRTLGQAHALDQHVLIEYVLYLACHNNDMLVKRLLNRAEAGNRADDRLDVIKRRLQHFEQQTRPVLDFYADRCTPIDGLRHPLRVHDDVLHVVMHAVLERPTKTDD